MRREITERAFRFALQVTTLRQDRWFRTLVEREVLGQLVRAATSVGANLEEATGAQTKPDFIAKASIARKEALEVQFWLRLGVAAGVLNKEATEQLRADALSIGQVISAIVRTAKQSDQRDHTTKDHVTS